MVTNLSEHVYQGVYDAIIRLGNAFLAPPCNADAVGVLPDRDYHQQLKRLVFRLLFLMVADDHGMSLPKAFDFVLPVLASERRGLVYSGYSIAHLRQMAAGEDIPPGTHIWPMLRTEFAFFDEGHGDILGAEALSLLYPLTIANEDIIGAIRLLSQHNGHQIDYRTLPLELLGAVNEGLMATRLRMQHGAVAYADGMDRKTSGSYYTNPDLIEQLLRTTLDPVMDQRLATASTREEREQAILTMSVLDPACGSGHFLLAAARRAGGVLARIRHDDPSETDIRRAIRDVIRRCIYGVDLNPMAVDIGKMVLWIEGHIPGLPPLFLDGNIKCGNALLGATRDMIAQGIPDGAFDDPSIRERNRREREQMHAPKLQECLF